MRTIKPRNLRIIGLCAALACLLQIYALCRYIKRLPDDWVGIALYIVTIYAFAAISVGFIFQSRKQKQ